MVLPDELFGTLESATLQARACAEEGARAALRALAVDRAEPFAAFTQKQKDLRNLLRGRARQLGKTLDAGLPVLAEEVAYRHWHRLLFARFLAEHGLLRHPRGMPVTMEDCSELAPGEGLSDGWAVATRYAGTMLPGILNDGVSGSALPEVPYAAEHRLRLQAILEGLPPIVFQCDDALGWMYQFWQKQRKDEVNASGRAIEGGDLPPVTQLFTEDYMVRFLLENSLGAWWAARRPESPLLADWAYLRRNEEGRPVAGAFPGWPERAAEVTVLDPCGGSGHFVLRAYAMLRDMRMEEEGLSRREASDAVLRDNLFMLELDPRCTQIAAFALSLAAWDDGGYRQLPLPHIACVGQPVTGSKDAWVRLAGDNDGLRTTLERLHTLFSEATTLGSLIDPAAARGAGTLWEVPEDDLEQLLGRALALEEERDPVAALYGETAVAVARAARLLSRRYTLVATNVPYLARGRQGQTLQTYLDIEHRDARQDLATAFMQRCTRFARAGGSMALVTPQAWRFLVSYKKFRHAILTGILWNMMAPLGPGAFRNISGEVVNVLLLVATHVAPADDDTFAVVPAADGKTPPAKETLLREAPPAVVGQATQIANPDARVTLEDRRSESLLRRHADGLQGVATGDYPRYGRYFWEIPSPSRGWSLQQSTVRETSYYGGREHIVFWQQGKGALASAASARVQGVPAWGHRGVAVSQMTSLPCTLYTGELFDNNTAVILPKDPAHLPAIWAYCSSPEFARDVRVIDKKLNVTNATLVKVPFDLQRWQRVAEEAGPLPEPHSNDPTQWLFRGDPRSATAPLQAAVARLLGYQWPQAGPDALSRLAVPDGILPLVAVAGQAPAAERLRAFLAAAWGGDWSPAAQEALLAESGYGGRTLEAYLRDGFFQEHCRLFRNRPFIWHVWDGRPDGFSALVNYHRLDRPTLQKLAHTYLGDWIVAQRQAADSGQSGAEGRLVAAQALRERLEAILHGERPYDIYVRWKPLHEQPLGWEPDLDDGVRLNVRPFVEAGVLRRKFSVSWGIDRGKDPDGGVRDSGVHLTRQGKQAARQARR